MTYTLKFAFWLKQKRIDAGLTQEQLAKKVECSTRSVQMYESGDRMPSLAASEALAKALGVSLKIFARRAK